MLIHSPIKGLVGSIKNQLRGQNMCVNYVFCVAFDCWMAPDGRWCCQTIFGPPGIARVMQVLEDANGFEW